MAPTADQKYCFQKKQATKRTIRPWKQFEDELLCSLVQQHSYDWKTISSLIQHRNPNQCLHRFRRIKCLHNPKSRWNKEEDALVLQLVQKHGKDWVLISKQLKRKTGKQIRQRYVNKLDPRIKTCKWTTKEDHIIIELYNKLGSRWNEIAQYLDGRSQNMVKNRFYSHIRRFYHLEQHVIKNEDGKQPNMELSICLSRCESQAMSKHMQPNKIDPMQLLLEFPRLLNKQSLPLPKAFPLPS